MHYPQRSTLAYLQRRRRLVFTCPPRVRFLVRPSFLHHLLMLSRCAARQLCAHLRNYHTFNKVFNEKLKSPGMGLVPITGNDLFVTKSGPGKVNELQSTSGSAAGSIQQSRKDAEAKEIVFTCPLNKIENQSPKLLVHIQRFVYANFGFSPPF